MSKNGLRKYRIRVYARVYVRVYVRVHMSEYMAGWCSPYFWGAIEHGEGSQLSQLHDLLAGQVPWLAVSNLLEPLLKE